MSTPVLENIAVNLVNLINEITIANGFNQDLTAVRPKRIHLEGDLNADNTVFVIQGPGSAEVDANEAQHWSETFVLQVAVIDSDEATDAVDIRMNKILADIQKKLMTGDNYKLGGYVDFLYIDSTDRYIGVFGSVPVSVLEISLIITTLLDTDDPYQNG